MVKMTHKDDPSGSVTEVPEKSFRNHWSNKGWVIAGEQPEVEAQEAEAEGEPEEEQYINYPEEEEYS